jgi:nitrile hydratase
MLGTVMGSTTIDRFRYTIEQMPPADYLASSYYERWLWRLEKLLVDKDFVHPDELGESRAATRVPLQDGALRREEVEPMLRRRRAARLEDPVAPCFHVGDSVRARNVNPVGHTRLPRYARGRLGSIVRDHGVFIFPDTHAAGEGIKPQHVYSVRFSAQELWGPEASPRDSVYIDLWDDYLESA